MQRVCLEYGIETKDLKVPDKYRHNSEARGAVAWLLLETGAATLSELSRFTGRAEPVGETLRDAACYLAIDTIRKIASSVPRLALFEAEEN